jgi:hypothetical protein
MMTQRQREFETSSFSSMLRQPASIEQVAAKEERKGIESESTADGDIMHRDIESSNAEPAAISKQPALAPYQLALNGNRLTEAEKTSMIDTSPSKSYVPSGCNCRNETNIWCCQRTAIVVQGIGFDSFSTRLQVYFGDSVDVQQITADHPYEEEFQFKFKRPGSDYRHVLISSNWHNAIVSGYLYHKAGYDCWVDPQSHDKSHGWLFDNSKEDWEKRITNYNEFGANFYPWPPGKGRSLCKYLADEAVESGLRVYSEWVLRVFLDPLMEFVRTRSASETKDGYMHTLFACNELEHAWTASSLHSFLYPQSPTSDPVTLMPNSSMTSSLVIPDDRKKTLQQLYDFVRTVDQTVYNGTFEHANFELGCRGGRAVAESAL